MIVLRRARSGPLPRPLLAGAALALSLLAASCNGSSSPSDGDASPNGPAQTTGTTLPPVEYPGERWATIDAAAAGFDPATLATIPNELDGTETDCVVVVKDGKLAYQHTWNGFDADADRVVWSVSKSITGLLVGIAAEEGKLRIEQPASDFVTEWKGTPAEAVTIRNLLSMDSGRHWDYQTDFVVMPLQTDDQTAFAIGLDQQFPPGTKWVYNNGAVQVLEAVLRRATGTPVVDYARDKLFAPLGIEATWLLDKAGHPWTYGGASMSCLEMARIGHLMLNDGRWKDRQVVPAAWVHDSVQPSQELRHNYGYLWWLNLPPGPPAAGQPADVQSGDVAPGVAPNAYFARGLLGQYIAVIPDDDTIVIRTGRTPPQPGRFKDEDEVLNELLAVVTKAEQANPD